MERRTQRIAIGIALAHTLLLAAYTMPPDAVPVRLRYWSQAYARVLFHQDWRLFAPDPPACGCSLEVNAGGPFGWRPMDGLHEHFAWDRMCANACRFAEAIAGPTDTVAHAPAALVLSLENMAYHLPRSEPLRYRVHRTCIGHQFIEIRNER
jgi:ABC-type phosphonate transport system ATPase subunit